MEPRGSHRARPGIVRAGVISVGYGIFGIALRVLDAVSRGETAMDVFRFLPHALRFLDSLWFSTCVVIAGFLFLWRFARASEKVGKSRIVDPNTLQPVVKPIYPAVRRAGLAFGYAICAALAVWGIYQTPLRALLISPSQLTLKVPTPPAPAVALLIPHPPNRTVATPISPAPKPEPSPPSGSNPSPKQERPDAGPLKASTTPPVINVPPHQAALGDHLSKSTVRTQATVTFIGENTVSAANKPSDTLYVSILISEVTVYRGGGEEVAQAVKTALEKTGKVQVFVGGYRIRTPAGQPYGIATYGHRKDISYVREDLSGACGAIKEIVSSVIGIEMRCVYHPVRNVNDAESTVNADYDFLVASGLDMEVMI